MFDYKCEHKVPWSVKYVLESRSKLWYNEKMCPLPLEFIFPKVKPPRKNESLIWRYQAEVTEGTRRGQNRIIYTGYFNLSQEKPTELNLEEAFGKDRQVKWVRFTVFDSQNPAKRAWFSPIRGEHFDRENGKKNITMRNFGENFFLPL